MNSDMISRALRRASIVGSLGLAPAAFGQMAVTGSPAQLEAPPAAGLLSPTGADAEFLFGKQNPESSLSFLRWGPVVAHPHISASFAYASHLRSRDATAVNSVTETVSPGVSFNLGRRWTLDYTPTLSFFSDRHLTDRLSHSVALQGGTSYGSWVYGLSQNYTTASQSLIETGRQTDTENFGTGLSASHYFNSKWMLELGVNQNIRSADSFNSSRSWSTMDWLNYELGPRLSFGVGAGGGFESVSKGSDMSFEQIEGRVTARISQKLNLNIHGGGEIRQVLDVSGGDLANPIYGASVQYRPFEHTILSLSGGRAVSASLLQNQITEKTDISLGLSQRLLGALSLSLGGAFMNTRFLLSAVGVPLSREDDTVAFFSSLGYGFLQNGSISIFFNSTDNTSSAGGFSSSATLYGLSIAYHF